MDIRYAKMLKWFQHNHPDKLDRWIESVSPNQIRCKMWLAEELAAVVNDKKQYWKEESYNIEIIGGWFAWPLLDYMSGIPLNKVRNVDCDEFCNKVSIKYNEIFSPSFEYQFFHTNITELKDTFAPRFVINTSCEHMAPMKEIVKHRGYIKEKAILILQSNNKTDESDHINCVFSADELIEQSGCEKIYYAGEKNMGSYTRFMVIGK